MDRHSGAESPERVFLYDTTLRDGAQMEDISFTLEDKLRIVSLLDSLGISMIEGGWPGANPKDREFFARVRDIELKNSRIAAFGSTRKAGNSVSQDPVVADLLEAKTPVVTIFGKSWHLHVRDILGLSREQNLSMIRETVDYLKQNGREVVYDAEHFFDGFADDPDFALETVRAARDAGADWLVLCDTNGGSLPERISLATTRVAKDVGGALGIHAHNDSELAVANSLAAVGAGARQVHGTINGIGERCGNANLVSVAPNLALKMGFFVMEPAALARLRDSASFVSELSNRALPKNMPFVGESAFAHKAGVHVHAVRKVSRAYEHIRPELVGNRQRILLSEQSGRSNLVEKARQYGLSLEDGDSHLSTLLARLKEMEYAGYQFEGADASFELLMRQALERTDPFFRIDFFRIAMGRGEKDGYSEATVQVRVGSQSEHTAALGNGPVNALDNALRKALSTFYPEVRHIALLDYKVRVLSGSAGTASRVRVLVESSDGHRKWGTVGVSENVIEASLDALKDSVEHYLLTSGALRHGD